MNYKLWKTEANWFASWFNSPAYHLLYGNRDENEASELVYRLHKMFGKEVSKILDAGCGAGRHVFAWAQLGYEVSGFDLSPESIKLAIKRAELLQLDTKFSVLDMRDLRKQAIWDTKFDLVTNLFTSFGYFSEEIDHLNVVEGFSRVLKPKGLLILDYLNLQKITDDLVATESINRAGVVFEINRRIHNGFIQKSISFIDSNGDRQTHVEQVYAWSHHDLKELLAKVGLKVEFVFGDYNLGMYSSSSPRCILVARKTEV
ncbi:MAG: SAM-dependent methyltransferase [Bacteroidetes bacterium]|nr:MAG: SAM-dependent methyltransferase [Bacteroidota bacterium]